MSLSNGYADLVMGPKNIERMEGDVNVIIPCSFYTNVYAVWEINGSLYNRFSIPGDYKIFSQGLLIPVVKSAMNGTVYRCYYSNGIGLQREASQPGMLRVMNPNRR